MTVPLNRDFQSENKQAYPQVIYNYFLGRVESVDGTGVLMSQLGGEDAPLQSYFFHPHIVCIAEEKEFREENPEDSDAIQELNNQITQQMEEYNEVMATQKQDSGSEINPESLVKLTEDLKKQYGLPKE